MKKEDLSNKRMIDYHSEFSLGKQGSKLFNIGEFYQVGTDTQGLVMACTDQNDVLFNTGCEFIWALKVEMDTERDRLIWENAYYFEEYAIVPAVEELKKYENHPGVITNGFAYAIDAVNHCAVLYSSNFPDEIAPINQLVTIPSVVEYQGQDYSVTAVADWAFYQNKQIANLALPDSIKTIGNYAFAKSDLKRLEMSSEVEKGKDIFFKCRQLVKPEINNDQESIIKKADLDYLYNCIEKAEHDGVLTNNRLWHHNAIQQMNVLYTQYLNHCDLQNHSLGHINSMYKEHIEPLEIILSEEKENEHLMMVEDEDDLDMEM